MMGIIYDTMRQNLNKEEEEYISPHENYNLISFCDFINLLELHTNDGSKTVCEYLISEDKFLKLDIYTQDMTNASASKGLLEFICHKYNTYHEYDGFKFNEELEYPTENFLEDFMLENGTRDYDSYYFWKIDDLLELDCMANIGLNENSFELCQYAMNGNTRIVLELTKQNKELTASLKEQNAKLIADKEENKATGSFMMGTPTVAHDEPKTIEQFREALAAANAKVGELESQLEKADIANNQADNVPHSNTDMQNVKKAAIKQFNRSLAMVLIDLDYQSNLRKGDIVSFIMPYMKKLAFVLADENADKAKSLIVKSETIYKTHLQGLEFKQGTQKNKDRERENVDLLFKKQLSVTE